MKLILTKLFAFFLTLTFVNHCFAQIAGNSLRLKADYNYVSIDDPSSLSLSDEMTWEFWIYNHCESGVFVTPITKGWCSSNWSYYFAIDSTNNTQFVFYKFDPAFSNVCIPAPVIAEYRSANGSIPFNTWTHVAMVMQGTTVQFYVNGQAVATTLTSGTPFTGIHFSEEPILIGAYRPINSIRYESVPKANIDEVRIWHTARTATEIQDHYQTVLAGNEAGLVAYYKFEQTGSGAGISVINSATGSGISNGITVGTADNILFENTNDIVNGTQDCNILPLQLLSFTAAKGNKNNILQWTTAHEINVDRFEIEQSRNGKEFGKIGQVKAGLITYTFNDNTATNATIYYRLKMVDKDGNFAYSKIVSVIANNIINAVIFPNPVTSIATVQLQSEHAESVTIKVVSSVGKILSTKSYNLTVGNNQITLNTERLTTGIYAVVIVGPNTKEHLTFSKQ